MSADQNVKATLSIVGQRLGEFVKGTCFVVHRMQGDDADDVIVCTSAHVIKFTQNVLWSFTFLDYKHRKYTDYKLQVIDIDADIALIYLRYVPQEIPCIVGAIPDQRGEVPAVGTPCYTIGWPNTTDTNSLSAGVVRNSRFAFGGLSSIVVDASCWPGNSGGGVFDAATHRLIGVCWYIYTTTLRGTVTAANGVQLPVTLTTRWDTFAGVAPGSLVGEALRTLLLTYPRPAVSNTVELRVLTRNEYFAGYKLTPLNYETSELFISTPIGKPSLHAQVPWLRLKANVGAYINSVLAVSPASDSTFIPGELLLAIRHDLPQGSTMTQQAIMADEASWILLTEDMPLSHALHTLAMQVRAAKLTAAASAAARRSRMPPRNVRRAAAQSLPLVENDSWLPEKLAVLVLSMFGSTPYLTPMLLPRRWDESYHNESEGTYFVSHAGGGVQADPALLVADIVKQAADGSKPDAPSEELLLKKSVHALTLVQG